MHSSDSKKPTHIKKSPTPLFMLIPSYTPRFVTKSAVTEQILSDKKLPYEINNIFYKNLYL